MEMIQLKDKELKGVVGGFNKGSQAWNDTIDTIKSGIANPTIDKNGNYLFTAGQYGEYYSSAVVTYFQANVNNQTFRDSVNSYGWKATNPLGQRIISVMNAAEGGLDKANKQAIELANFIEKLTSLL